jgi:hypothetical protein
MKKFIFLSAILTTSTPSFGASVFDYINSADFKLGVKASFLSSVAGVAQRSNIILKAQEECGGRYEGTEIEVAELKHTIDASDKQVIHTANPQNYSVVYKATSKNVWQVNETIKCSFHGGHNRSVLHAKIFSGVETAKITYVYVNDVQVGVESVVYLSRTYSPHASVLQYSYQTPYGTVIAP